MSPMNSTQSVLAIEAALTDTEKALFLERFVGMNPHWDGAHVADCIDVLHDADAGIAVSEPMYADHAAGWTPLHWYAIHAATFITPNWPDPPDWTLVDRIARTARRAAERTADAD